MIPQQPPCIRQVRYRNASLVVLANEDVGRQICFLGAFESDDLDMLCRWVRPGSVCFDVGANCGVVSILMACASPNVHVHAFEPLPLNVNLVRTNSVLNSVDIEVNCVAVADRQGHMSFSEAEDGAYSSLHATGRRPERRKIEVDVTTLDQYCSERRVDRVDVLKIDVEGAEELVLIGGRATLGNAATAPAIIMIELYDENLNAFGSSIDSVVGHLYRAGYAAFVCAGNGRMVPFAREHHNRKVNVFFLRRDADAPNP